MRTQEEWQAREKELLEANNTYLKRARKAEAALAAIAKGKPQFFWYAEDPESGNSSVSEIFDTFDPDFWEPIEIWTGYNGPTIFAAQVRTTDGEERRIIEAPTETECLRLIQDAMTSYNEHKEENDE